MMSTKNTCATVDSINAFSTYFTKGVLIDLETDGQIISYSPIEVYTYIKTHFLLPRDISQEITKTKTDLKVAYDPDNIIQVYYKKMQISMLTLAALGNVSLMRK